MFLVVLGDSIASPDQRAVVIEPRGLAGGSAPLQSFLARGYWEEWNGTPKEAAAIIARLPTKIPTAVAALPS